MIASLNPWLTMWTRPGTTIRVILHNKPLYGVIYLSTIYALQSIFFYLNWWSLGVHSASSSLFFAALISAPFIGAAWLYLMGAVFFLTGRLLKGTASAKHLRTSIAWSKIPTSINLLLWIFLIFVSAETVFIQDGGGPSSVLINLMTLILGIWSFVLLVQGIAEAQQFSIRRSLINILLSLILYGFLFFVIFISLRYIYISI